MSWADKQLKKHKLRKQIKEIMDSPEFQKERQKELGTGQTHSRGNELFSADQRRLFVPELSLQKKGSFEISGICFTPDAFCAEGRGIFSADE